MLYILEACVHCPNSIELVFQWTMPLSYWLHIWSNMTFSLSYHKIHDSLFRGRIYHIRVKGKLYSIYIASQVVCKLYACIELGAFICTRLVVLFSSSVCLIVSGIFNMLIIITFNMGSRLSQTSRPLILIVWQTFFN